MKLKFIEGRQGTGYQKFTIFSSKRLNMDMHILVYPDGSHIPPHIDKSPSKNHSHKRMNIILKKGIGGEFTSDDPDKKSLFGRVIVFSPEYLHTVSEVVKSKRIVFSIGWLKKIKRG